MDAAGHDVAEYAAAVPRIQCVARGWLARATAKRRRCAAAYLQRIARSWLARLHLCSKTMARAVMGEAIARERTLTNAKAAAAIRIESLVRGVQCRARLYCNRCARQSLQLDLSAAGAIVLAVAAARHAATIAAMSAAEAERDIAAAARQHYLVSTRCVPGVALNASEDEMLRSAVKLIKWRTMTSAMPPYTTSKDAVSLRCGVPYMSCSTTFARVATTPSLARPVRLRRGPAFCAASAYSPPPLGLSLHASNQFVDAPVAARLTRDIPNIVKQLPLRRMTQRTEGSTKATVFQRPSSANSCLHLQCSSSMLDRPMFKAGAVPSGSGGAFDDIERRRDVTCRRKVAAYARMLYGVLV